MSEHINFGIETTDLNNRLYLDIPAQVAAKVQKNYPQVNDEFKDLGAKRNRIIDLESVDTMLRLFINTKKIGAKREDYAQRQAARRVMDLVTSVGIIAGRDRKDPLLDVSSGYYDSNDGRQGMKAKITWPLQRDEAFIRRLSTYHMHDTAIKLRYVSKKILPETVGTAIDRSSGVSIVAHSLGSSTLDTDGNHYRPDEAAFEVEGHNLYSPLQQIVCLAGAIAIAKADELELPVST